MNWQKVADYLDRKSDEYRDHGSQMAALRGAPHGESLIVRADAFKVLANAIREGLR
jgi:hypothetical protein